MNGAFRHEPLPVFGDRLANIRSWWARCAAVEAEGFLVTSWEPCRLALETTTVVDAAAANLWLDPAQDDATAMLARGLERTFKSKVPRPLARALLTGDEHAFVGYARWQINERWDVFAGGESLKPYLNAERFFARLLATGMPWPRAFAASLAFRHYLARRDVFVRQAAREVFRLRRMKPTETAAAFRQLQAAATAFGPALRDGRQAARAMWSRTREPQVRGQNEVMLDMDETRLVGWREWLKRVTKDPELLWQATPVCGAWQLQFMVHNFAPAVQKVVVEQQETDGSWRPLAARYTIEFRAQAARPHCRLKREFTVPVPTPDTPLRLAVHGVGQVAISHAVLTDGLRRIAPANYRAKRILGQPAPQRGFPQTESARSNPALALNFPTPAGA
jgi:hypothetical protein